MDKIAEMLTKIRNAQMAGHKEVFTPSSKFKLAVAKILESENFIETVSLESGEKESLIKIGLKYNTISNTKKEPAISGIKKVSRLGQRIYIKKEEIRKVKNGFGIGIISTSKGVMTDKKSREMGLGGEYICEVW